MVETSMLDISIFIFLFIYYTFRVMGEVLNAWCEKGTLNSRNATKLSEALEQARLTHHAKVIKELSSSMSSGKSLHEMFIV